jgi:hypothetical protein
MLNQTYQSFSIIIGDGSIDKCGHQACITAVLLISSLTGYWTRVLNLQLLPIRS